MTVNQPDDTLCVLCGRAPGDASPLDRTADSGPMLLAVHSDGVACGYVAHDLCVRYVRANGPLADVDCLCGAGPVVEGIAPPDSWSAPAPTRRGHDEAGRDESHQGWEPPTERGEDERDEDERDEDADTDSDSDSPYNSDSETPADFGSVCSACTLPTDLAESWSVVDPDTDAPCGCHVHRHCTGLRASDPFQDRCLCGRNPLMAFTPTGGADD